MGRIIGGFVKSMVLRDDSPLRRNAPTAKELVITGESALDLERQRLLGLMERFAMEGPRACSTHPHPFFGKLSASEWAILMYKHTDHHLRQFGV